MDCWLSKSRNRLDFTMSRDFRLSMATLQQNAQNSQAFVRPTERTEYDANDQQNVFILDFRFSPCSESCMFSFGYFPGVRLSFARQNLM
jgi:hypothetical protein